MKTHQKLAILMAFALAATPAIQATNYCCAHQQPSVWSQTASFGIKVACAAGAAYLVYDYFFTDSSKLRALIAGIKAQLEGRIEKLEEKSKHVDELTKLSQVQAEEIKQLTVQKKQLQKDIVKNKQLTDDQIKQLEQEIKEDRIRIEALEDSLTKIQQICKNLQKQVSSNTSTIASIKNTLFSLTNKALSMVGA